MAEINFNNLYNQLSPMDKLFYDQQFQKKYDPNQQNLKLSSQPAYNEMKSVYNAQQQVPEKGMIAGMVDFLNPFSSASAAEMPQIPNLSLGDPQINFNNTSGITGASNAFPMINNVPMINTGAVNQRLQNTNLVDEIIAANKMKTKLSVDSNGNIVEVPNQTSQIGFPNKSPFLFNQQETIPSQSMTPLDMKRFEGVSDLGRQDEDVEQVEKLGLPFDKTKSKGEGLAGLFRALLSFLIPGAGFLLNKGKDSMRGIKSLNQRLQNSDFGRSKSLTDYFDMKKHGGFDARNRKASKTMREARGIQKAMDMRSSAIPTNQDKGRGLASIPSRSKPSTRSPQTGRQAEKTRSRDLGSMRGGVGR